MPRTPRYEPDRARFVANGDGLSLYKTKSGRFFTERQVDGGIFLSDISAADAESFARIHADPATFAVCFDPRKPVKISFDVPPDLLERVDACRNEQLKTRRAVILAALDQYTRSRV